VGSFKNFLRWLAGNAKYFILIIAFIPVLVIVGRDALGGSALTTAALFLVGALVAFLPTWMARYLETDRSSTTDETEELRARIAELADKVAGISQTTVPTPERTVQLSLTEEQAVVNQIAERAMTHVGGWVFNYVQEELEKRHIENVAVTNTLRALQSVNIRLMAAKREVQRRANLNLIIGSLIAIGGLAFLAFYVVTSSSPAQETWDQAFVRYLPRIALVFIIELLAYFFLRLYRFGATEIRYFQNELTNVEFWTAGFAFVLMSGDKTKGVDIASRLMTVERNFVLQKGETAAPALTESKEAAMIEPSDIRDLLALLKSLKPKSDTAS